MNYSFTFPIRYVARRTGLTSHVIRAWEKRYGAVTPARTETNRRAYSQDDIGRLMLLKRAVDAGIPIGDVARLDTDGVTRLVQDSWIHPSEPIALRPSSPEGPPPLTHFDACVAAVIALEPEALESALNKALVGLDKTLLIDRVVVPLTHTLGDLWEQGLARVAHEHMTSAVLRTFLGDMLRFTHVSETAPTCLFATPAGQHHELGALMAATAGALHDWRSIYLGPDVPAEEIAAAVEGTGATMVGLSIVYPADDPALQWELQRIHRHIPNEVTVVAGGHAAPAYDHAFRAIGAIRFSDLASFRRMLIAMRS